MNWMTTAKNRVNRAKRKTDQSRMMGCNKIMKTTSQPQLQWNPNAYPNSSSVSENQSSLNAKSGKTNSVSRDVFMLLGHRKAEKANISIKTNVLSGGDLETNRSKTIIKNDPLRELQLSPLTRSMKKGFEENREDFGSKYEVVELIEELNILFFNDGHACNEEGQRTFPFAAADGDFVNTSKHSHNRPLTHNEQQQGSLARVSMTSNEVHMRMSVVNSTNGGTGALSGEGHTAGRPAQSLGVTMRAQQRVVSVERNLNSNTTYNGGAAGGIGRQQAQQPDQPQQQQQQSHVHSCGTGDMLSLFDSALCYSASSRHNNEQFTALDAAVMLKSNNSGKMPHNAMSHKILSYSVSVDSADSNNSSELQTRDAHTSEHWWGRCRQMIANKLSTTLADNILHNVMSETSGGTRQSQLRNQSMVPTTRQVLGVLYRQLGSELLLSGDGSTTHLFDIIRFVETADKQMEGSGTGSNSTGKVDHRRDSSDAINADHNCLSYLELIKQQKQQRSTHRPQVGRTEQSSTTTAQHGGSMGESRIEYRSVAVNEWPAESQHTVHISDDACSDDSGDLQLSDLL